ncbi:hypothetical protein SAMN04487949_0104 [Halogranum gelatinilyticum]|uniref:DUF7967 domain-containing protein n=1 Tax=Halogranum gelatinilyticum TaxID=660521 RepID=A0A1G9NV45_9EURY|nr:hypothetical protein [Halogranum gelatinilyticum]SDL89855.1 hypothetical protein SAMN04487949_0104 [Halogranum gelatinilyticum]
MTDTVRLWLVERSYDDRNLITLVYATPEGDGMLQKEIAATIMHQRGSAATAAIDVEPDRVDDVADEADRERYATEAARMAEQHDPDDEV